ncbi:WXG100 family type VII secretion target [Nocardioides daphniae]|uniref:ESAT-6-like protein n=1 Tax=Nocardioides daphniae TaxID=402297 RepID=A0A4P7UIS2_9ACTN|nr:WXG100 family type VII secretion target [Nocardioides daphniae]QCC78399.1 WXG100 family type VII secretion target [Nocardioides daphniae]GGD12783.1 hypothetical protein GCM10007231_09750 [Nocardioides daphniae]
MFSGIQVDHGQLDEASRDLVQAAVRIEGRLDQLESELAPLRSSWGGSAQESYVLAQRQWDAAMVEMVTLLRDFSVGVTEANEAYRAADLRGSRRFG